MGSIANKHILLVDDDQFLLDMYTAKFTEKGFEVTSVTGAEEALARLREGLPVDVIMMDMVLPATEGIGILEKIKEENLAPGAVRVVLSNKADPDEVEKAKELGAVDYIVKAETVPSEVLERVRALIFKKET